MFRLVCKVQNYAWGKVGLDSEVAKLKEAAEPGSIDAAAPYAEYWFGTHPNGPSSIVIPGSDGAEDEVVPLQDWLKAHPDALGGEAVAALCEGDSALPYLFKVLSINKALSIQAHPAKERASILHGERPDVYKDGNHKPEMTCALTPMDAMCGFRSAPEIAEHLRTVPELRAMCGEEASEAFVAESKASEDGSVEPATLKGLFTSYMTCEPAVVAEQSAALASRLDSAPAGTLSSTDAHALRLTREYPGDVGVVAPYVLNCVTLSPGQGLFLAANEPHAYMSGDCFEIMACSDNVVRAGLTPKLRDVDTLCDILTYRMGDPDLVPGEDVDEFLRCYRVPVPEFLLQRILVPPDATYTLPTPESAAIIVVYAAGAGATATVAGDGEGCGTQPIARGATLLQVAGSALSVSAGGEGETVLFRAHTDA